MNVKGMMASSPSYSNASSLKCECVMAFLASENVDVVNHSPYAADPSLCDRFISGTTCKSRSSLGSVIYQCLQKLPTEDYLTAFY